MSLTINGRRTGAAGATERRERSAWLENVAARERERFRTAFRWNLRRLKRVDPDWEAWYDGRPEQTLGEMLPLIRERVEQLKHSSEPLDEREAQAAEGLRIAEWTDSDTDREPSTVGEAVAAAYGDVATNLYLRNAAAELRREVPENFGMIVLVGEELDAVAPLVRRQKNELGFSTIESHAAAVLRSLEVQNEWGWANVEAFQKSMDNEITKEANRTE